MRETKTIAALDEDLIIIILQHLDDIKLRARLACVCKFWRACVKRSWERVHFCCEDVETFAARLNWLANQLDHPLVLQSLELQSGLRRWSTP